MNHFLLFDAVVLSYFFLVGHAPFLILNPREITSPWGTIAVSLLYGTAILCLGAAYVVWIGAPVRTLNWIGLSLALSSLVILIRKLYRGRDGFDLRVSLKRLPSVVFVALSCVLAAEAFLLPSLSSDGTFSTPIHLGVDAAGYGVTASYLVTWNGRDSLEADLLRETGTEDLAAAKSKNDNSLNFQIEVASEFILKALRWSYPTVIASVTELLGFDSVYRPLFRSLFPSVVSLFLLVFCFSRKFTKGFLFPTAVASSVLLNCNLLNLALQGQYAHVVSAPLFLYLLYSVLEHRQCLDRFPRYKSRRIAGLALITGALMVLYNEAIVVFAIFIGLVIVLDLILFKTFPSRSLLVFIVTFSAAGLILAWPITAQWLFFLKKHLINIKIAGWWQPHWANPAEIFGMGNIYSEFAIHELTRDPVYYAFTIFFSLMLCAILFFTWKESNTIYDWSMIGAAIIFPVTVFVKTFFFERIHNYQYMKAYAMVLPFLASTLYLCTASLIPRNIFAKQFKACLIGSMFGLVLFNGGMYLYKAVNDRYLARESFYQALQALDKLRGYAVWVYHADNRTFLFGATDNFHWLNRGATRSATNHRNETIAILLYKDQPNPKPTLNVPSSRVLFENDLVKVIDSSRYVKEFLDDQNLFVDVNRLATFLE